MFAAKELGNNIRNYRRRKGLSQGTLAERLCVTPQSVSKWEHGTAMPGLDSLCMMAQILNVSTDALLGTQNSTERVMIGIDGGGTKTEFILFSESWKILKRIVLDSCNPNAIGIEESVAVFSRGIDALTAYNPNVCGIYIGASGFGLGKSGAEVQALLEKKYPDIKICSGNDILNVIACATDADRCVAVICGTGSIVFAKEQEKLTRLTGWGYLLSKLGSGFDIGRDVLYAALQEREGLGQTTILTQAVEKKLGCTVADAIMEIYSHDQSYIASFAPLAVEAYHAGDQVAREILCANAGRIAQVINHAAERYDCGRIVVLSGGMFTSAKCFLQLVKEQLNPRLETIVPRNPQVYGACLLCARMCNASCENASEKFWMQYQELLKK